ncbi:MAG: Crp/Fnr family transcriptional regulator [Alphaproteobacteria bacterium]|nr:Crp/Fnr family transcriptional regulator [Alphaproteobacteria bacterium]
MSEHRQTETLARFSVFEDLSAGDVNQLNTQCVWRRFEAESEILSHTDETTNVYFVVSGMVRVIIFSVLGKDTVYRDIDAGDYFGEIAAIDGRPRTASVVARTNTVVAIMPAQVFRTVTMQHASVSFRILERTVLLVRELSERINEFRTLDVRHRIYRELLRLARPPKTKGAEAVISPPPMHQEIADRISTRREAVSRELKQLERDGLLRRRRGALVITDADALANRIEGAREGT